MPGRSHRLGVTSDGAENAPRLRVLYGEDSQESEPPLKHRVETHTASAQGSPAPVPWRWRSRGARIRESHRPNYAASANGRRQQGHSPSCPWIRAENAVGCGMDMIALNASGARWA